MSMSKTTHRIYLFTLTLIVIISFAVIIQKGLSFYKTSIEERFFHADYKSLKPSGTIGHGFGILGSFLMIVGVISYMLRKRFRLFFRLGLLKHWLEFHIFLCALGPMLVLFHTSFKFGGIASISFWSMVAVFLSGIVGRFIYIQIPRTIEGRELSLHEISNMKTDICEIIKDVKNLDEASLHVIIESTKKKVGIYNKNIFVRYYKSLRSDSKTICDVKISMKKNKLSKEEYVKILHFIKNEISLNRKIEMLTTMQNLLKYWHAAHLPFAFVMLIIMVIHVVITILFGYKWIF